MDNTLYRLLALCARARCSPGHHEQIAEPALQVADWGALPALARAHGLGPLARAHLTGAGVVLPEDVALAMRGIALHYRLANAILTTTLGQVLAFFREADVPALVLKGGALAHLVYPDPGLRPMPDFPRPLICGIIGSVKPRFEANS